MCHQTIEKILKAYLIERKQETIPFSHSLSYLAKKAEIYADFTEEQKDFIDQLEPLNIEARYPSDKEKLLRSLSENKCKEILSETKKLQEWIRKKL